MCLQKGDTFHCPSRPAGIRWNVKQFRFSTQNIVLKGRGNHTIQTIDKEGEQEAENLWMCFSRLVYT